MTKKLYKVTLRGMRTGISSTVSYGVSYVVADDPSGAYEKVRRELDAHDIGFSSDRELDKVELLAEEALYPDCGTILYI